MLLGGSLFDDLEDDPFFSGRQQMHQMFHAPFGFGLQGQGMAALTDGQHGNQHRQHKHRREKQLSPYSMFNHGLGVEGIFSNMSNMMSDMQRSFETTRKNTEAHCFTQSSFYSCSNAGQGTPKVYQATSSTRMAPGGIKEVKKTERDSESGLQKMSVGHHINNRAHVIERSQNMRTGNKEENQEFINLDEGEVQVFDSEWQDKTKHRSKSFEQKHNGRARRHVQMEQRALPKPGQDEKLPGYKDNDQYNDRHLRKERKSYKERD